jgi:hypothetical protein
LSPALCEESSNRPPNPSHDLIRQILIGDTSDAEFSKNVWVQIGCLDFLFSGRAYRQNEILTRSCGLGKGHRFGKKLVWWPENQRKWTGGSVSRPTSGAPGTGS